MYKAIGQEFSKLLAEAETAKKLATAKKKQEALDTESEKEESEEGLENSIAKQKQKRVVVLQHDKSADTKSNKSSARGRKKNSAATTGSQPDKVQAQIGYRDTGHLLIQPPKCKLQILWEDYRDARVKYVQIKKDYEEELAATKWAKLMSDDEQDN